MAGPQGFDQLELIGSAAKAAATGKGRARKATVPGPTDWAEDLPVARVLVQAPVAHLDREFDYGVPVAMAEQAQPGVRVKVRLAGQELDGFITERIPASDHDATLRPLRRVVGSQPVLRPEILQLARTVAKRFAAGASDLVRLAIPPRHARAEKEFEARWSDIGGSVASKAVTAPEGGPGAAPDSDPQRASHQHPKPAAGTAESSWSHYPSGAAMLQHLRSADPVQAVWTSLPQGHWRQAIAEAVRATSQAGQRSIIVVPDNRDLDLLEPVIRAELGADAYVRLEATLGPQARYDAFLTALHGRVQAVIGTRSAIYAPLPNVGLIVVWQDGDDSHREPRAPYVHVRDVALLRSQIEKSSLIVGGWTASAWSAHLLEQGTAHEVRPHRQTLRDRWADIRTVSQGFEDEASRRVRIPSAAFRTITQGLNHGAVLIQVPRAGYIPAVSCDRCRQPARCRQCSGPLSALSGDSPEVVCRWCRHRAQWACSCGATALRAVVVGVERTIEELGRAFPQVSVHKARSDQPVLSVQRKTLVVSTPGIEPAVVGGYAAAVFLDGDQLLALPITDAYEQALLRWMQAAALVRSRVDGGRILIHADSSSPAVQALIRADPLWWAQRECAERAEAHLPPVWAMFAVDGPWHVLEELRRSLPEGSDCIGPLASADLAGVPAGPSAGTGVAEAASAEWERPGLWASASVGSQQPARLIIRAPRAEQAELAGAIRAFIQTRSAKHDGGTLRVRVDPLDPMGN